MGINLGSTPIQDLKLGSTQVSKVYLGTEQVWPTGGSEDPTTWTGIQQIVQNGHASNYWAVGDEISVACPWTDPSSGTTYNWMWVVADLGDAYKESDPNTAVPAMTLLAKYTTPETYMFDAPEKVEADEVTAQDGTYYYGRVSGTTMTALNLATGATIPYGDYSSVLKSSINTSGDTYSLMWQHGYNNWELSNIRQWLNTAAAANSWFVPTHVGDSAPSYASQAGFLSGFSAEFQSILTPTRSGVAANTVTDGGMNYYIYDKMFLPSSIEVDPQAAPAFEGPLFAAYANAQNADRVKYMLNNQSSAGSWWLRSSMITTVDYEVYVYTSGGRASNGLTNRTNVRVAPACRIC